MENNPNRGSRFILAPQSSEFRIGVFMYSLLSYRRSEEGGGFSYSLPSFAEFARLTMASEG